MGGCRIPPMAAICTGEPGQIGKSKVRSESWSHQFGDDRPGDAGSRPRRHRGLEACQRNLDITGRGQGNDVFTQRSRHSVVVGAAQRRAGNKSGSRNQGLQVVAQRQRHTHVVQDHSSLNDMGVGDSTTPQEQARRLVRWMICHYGCVDYQHWAEYRGGTFCQKPKATYTIHSAERSRL